MQKAGDVFSGAVCPGSACVPCRGVSIRAAARLPARRRQNVPPDSLRLVHVVRRPSSSRSRRYGMLSRSVIASISRSPNRATSARKQYGSVSRPPVRVQPPLLEDHPGLLQCIEDFQVQQLVPEPGVEALAVAVLPGAAGLDEQRPDAQAAEPGPQRLGAEPWAVVRADVPGRAAGHEQLGQKLGDAPAVMRRATRIVRYRRLNSSTTVRMRSTRPPWVRARTKP